MWHNRCYITMYIYIYVFYDSYYYCVLSIIMSMLLKLYWLVSFEAYLSIQGTYLCVCLILSAAYYNFKCSSMTDFLLSVTLACHCVWGVSPPKGYDHSLRERESSANSLTCGVQRNCASDCHRGTLLITCHLSRLSVGLPSYANYGAYQSKHMKVKKNAIAVLGQNTLCKFTG